MTRLQRAIMFTAAVILLLMSVPVCAVMVYYAYPEYLEGDYSVRAAVTSCGPALTDDVENPVRIGVNRLLPFQIYFYNDTQHRLVQPVTDIDGYDDPYDYYDTLEVEWDFGDGSDRVYSDGITPSLRHAYSAIGVYTVHWKMRDLHQRYGSDIPDADDHPASDPSEAPDPDNWDVEGDLYVQVVDDTTPPVFESVTDDGDFTASTTTLHATWSAQDPDSGIRQYLYAIGTTPGGGDISTWRAPSPANATEVTRTDLHLTSGTTCFFSVYAYNGMCQISDMRTSDGITVDAASPTVVDVTSSKPDGAYGAGEVIDIQVTFSEAVNVTDVPQLELETGTTDRLADYSSGSGGSVLTFAYTVQAGDVSPDLDYTGTDALSLNAGTIADAAGNDAVLALPEPGQAHSLGYNKSILIQAAIPPQISVAPAAFDKACRPGATMTDSLTVGNSATAGAEMLNFAVAITGASGGGSYAWQDSTQPGGPTLNWIDISATGTQVTGLGDGGSVGSLPIGFDFPYYGNSCTTFCISSDGLIGLGGGSCGYIWSGDQPIPSAEGPNNAIYWMWADLYEKEDSAVYYETRTEGLVVQFVNYGTWSYYGNGRITAEVVLEPTGGILIQYQSVSADWPMYNFGTIGIENADGTRGVQVACGAPYVQSGLALRIQPGNWLSISPPSASVAAGQSTDLSLTFDAGALQKGDHSATIELQSNDPQNPLVTVPVVLHVQDPVATPVFDLAGGVYNEEKDVTVTCATAGAEIHYTTDGSEPTESSLICNGSVHVDRSMTLTAKAFKTDWPESDPAQASYDLQPLSPVFTPSGGVFTSAPEISMSCATPSSEIRYTTDGSEPTLGSSAYSTPVPVSDGMRLRAKAFRTGWTQGLEASADYRIIPYSSAIVTASFPDFFYIETEDRSRGIRVDKVAHGLLEGAKVGVTGTESTNADGERFIQADAVTQAGSGEVRPLGVNNKTIGGGPSGYNAGITGAHGWNNTGMLLKTSGRVTYADQSGGYFYIDDGSSLDDGSTHTGIRVLAPAGFDLGSLTVGAHVIVIGISSCFTNGSGQVQRLLRTRTPYDIAVVDGAGELVSLSLYMNPQDRFSLPLAPLDPDPVPIFSPYTSSLNRLEATSEQFIQWSPFNGSFGNMLLGDGYGLYIWQGGWRTFTYYGLPDGLWENNFGMADMCVSLPGKADGSGGNHWIGHPLSHEVEWSTCLVTDGIRTVPVWDNDPGTDDAVHLGWLDDRWSYLTLENEPIPGTAKCVDPEEVDGSKYLKPGRGYTVVTHKPDLAFIIPVSDSSPPSTPTVTDDGTYTNNPAQLHAAWSATDPESGVKGYEYAVGQTQTPPENPADYTVPWTPVGRSTSAMPSGLTLQERQTYYFYVKAQNGAGISGDPGSSDGISVDTTDPVPGVATPPATANANPIMVAYSGASDEFSGLSKVELWYKEGTGGAWTYSGSYRTGDSGSFGFIAETPATYYFDLVAEDNAGNRSAAPTGDGDGSTVFADGPGTTGRAYIRSGYLYPGGPLTQTTAYDATGSQVRQASLSYGEEGELLSTSGSAEPKIITYDSLYRTKTIADGNSHTTTYSYDVVDGSLSEVRYPGGDAVQFDTHYPEDLYDPNAPADDKVLYLKRTTGKYVEGVFNADAETKFIYDDPGNLLSHIEYPPATPSKDVHFVYDDYGRLSRTWDGLENSPTTGKKVYSYDNLDIVKDVTTTYAGLPATAISYGYYDDGSLSTMTIPTPSGTREFSCNYDIYGRLTDLTNPYGETFSWTYKLNDWLETQTLKNDSQQVVARTTYDYNPRGFLTSLLNESSGGATLSQFGGTTSATRMSYDAVGNLLSMLTRGPGLPVEGELSTYGYDTANPLGPRDRLTQEQSERGGGYTNTFQYDDAGNPILFRGASQGFNENNQRNDAGFVYDYRGNPTTYRDASSLSYDMENRLTSYGSLLSAGYTGDGLRAYKTSATGTRYFLYDGVTPVCEMDGSGNVVAVNTFGANGLVSRREGGASTFYTFDPQGNVAQAVGPSGTSNLLYDAYGNRLSTDSAAPYGFGGQSGYYTDPETGLVLATNRYYDPAEGRWLTRDPIGYGGGMNLYGYVGGNPPNLNDPTGFFVGHDVAVLGAAGAAMANQEVLENQRPGAWGIIKSGTLTTLNDIGAGLLGVLDFGTGTANFIEKPSLETAAGLCQDIATAASAGAAGLSAGARLAARLGPATAEAAEAEALAGYYKGGGASFGAEHRLLPEGYKPLTDWGEVTRRLENYHGIDPKLAGNRLHEIKSAAGRGPADNVVFDKTGGVYDPVTREFLGSLTEGGARWKF